jgi:hypothetical protein
VEEVLVVLDKIILPDKLLEVALVDGLVVLYQYPLDLTR